MKKNENFVVGKAEGDHPDTGVLFINLNRERECEPSHVGRFNVDGHAYNLIAFKLTDRNKNDYFSMRILKEKPKQDK